MCTQRGKTDRLHLNTLIDRFTRDETKLQTHEYNGSSQRGFRIEQGGREAAEKAYEAYVRSKQTNGGTAQDQGNTNEEQDVMAV